MKTVNLIDEKIVKNNLINLKNLVFEVTEKCNLCCKYCGLSERLYEKYDTREWRDLPFEKARLMIDYLVELWKDNFVKDTNMPFIVGFYGGEPLLNISLIKQIIEYIEGSNIVGRKIYYSMTTNGMLLNRYMDFLKEKNFNLAISLDGDVTSQSYRVDFSGNNSYERVFQNIKSLQEKYPDYFNSECVTFISVLHNRNDVEPLLDFFKKHFNKVPIILPLSSHNINKDRKDEFMAMYQNKLQSLMKSINCEAIEDEYFLTMPRGLQLAQYLYHTSGNIYYNYNQLLMSEYGKQKISTGTCTPFSKKLFLAVDGKILPCERIDHDFEMGYVQDHTVELSYEGIAEQHNNLLQKISSQCFRCAGYMNCFQCVYHIDDIRDTVPHCRSFCTVEKFNEERTQNMSYLRKNPGYYEKVLKEVSFTL